MLIEDFIEDNLDLIDRDKWEELYKKANEVLGPDTGKFTEMLFEANIHPENTLTYIPSLFLFDSAVKLSEFRLPEGITSIGEHAFSSTDNIEKIILPDSVHTIFKNAFQRSGLKEIFIGSGLKYIGSKAFQDCVNLRKIIHNGTSEDWRKISKGDYVFRMSGNYKIKHLK